VTQGEILDLLRLIPEQHFTQPPPALQRSIPGEGTGREWHWPAQHYATIISTLLDRDYVIRVEKRPRLLTWVHRQRLLVKHSTRSSTSASPPTWKNNWTASRPASNRWCRCCRSFTISSGPGRTGQEHHGEVVS